MMMPPASGMAGRRLLAPIGSDATERPSAASDTDAQLIAHLEAALDLLRARTSP